MASGPLLKHPEKALSAVFGTSLCVPRTAKTLLICKEEEGVSSCTRGSCLWVVSADRLVSRLSKSSYSTLGNFFFVGVVVNQILPVKKSQHQNL
ncbi:hypothetical protein STEG23_010454, partial [Scotinomys teguina]